MLRCGCGRDLARAAPFFFYELSGATGAPNAATHDNSAGLTVRSPPF